MSNNSLFNEGIHARIKLLNRDYSQPVFDQFKYGYYLMQFVMHPRLSTWWFTPAVLSQELEEEDADE